jgi:hypothetical protein
LFFQVIKYDISDNAYENVDSSTLGENSSREQDSHETAVKGKEYERERKMCR